MLEINTTAWVMSDLLTSMHKSLKCPKWLRCCLLMSDKKCLVSSRRSSLSYSVALTIKELLRYSIAYRIVNFQHSFTVAEHESWSTINKLWSPVNSKLLNLLLLHKLVKWKFWELANASHLFNISTVSAGYTTHNTMFHNMPTIYHWVRRRNHLHFQ